MPTDEIDVALETDLVDALRETGKGGAALRRADSLAERAVAAGDPVGELCGRIKAGELRSFFEPEGSTDQLAALIEQALPVFRAAGDDLALYTGYSALGHVANMRAQMDAMLEAFEQAAAHARLAGQPHGVLGVARRGSFLRHDAGPGTARVAGRAGGQAAQTSGSVDTAAQRLRCSAVSTRRGRSSPNCGRSWPNEAAESRSRLLTGHASVDVELLAGDPGAAASLGKRDASCSTSWAK